MRNGFFVANVILVACAGQRGDGVGPGAKTPPVVDLTVPESASRAMIVANAEQLLTGPMAKGRVGDIRLWNSKVAFIVGSSEPSDGYGPYGGEVIAADRVRHRGEVGASTWGEILSSYDFRTPRNENVAIVADGTAGGPAIVRATGGDGVIPVIESILSRGSPSQPLGAEITTDYILEPGAEYLKIVRRIKNVMPRTIRVAMNVVGFVFGDGARSLFPSVGFKSPPQGRSMPYFAAVGPDISYGWYAAEAYTVLFDFHSLVFAAYPSFEVPMGQTHAETRYLVVGNGDVESLAGIAATILTADRSASIAGSVVDEAGKPVPGALVHILEEGAMARDSGYVSNVRADASGAFRGSVPPGRYDLFVTTEARPLSAAVMVDATADNAVTARLVAAALGRVKVNVREEPTSEAIPAKLIVKRADGAWPSFGDARFGTVVFDDRAVLVDFIPSSGKVVSLPTGRYRAVLARGFEYTISEAPLEVRAGEETAISATLKRVVDTTGFLSGDFHVHAKYSPDSSDTIEHKVLASAAEGVEILVSTEHEYISDWRPGIAASGVEKWVNTVLGEEVTTATYGHFNAFPLAADPGAPNNGAVDWAFKKPAVMFADVRRRFPNALLQVNHPRSGGFMGYFASVAFEPATGRTQNAEMWSEDFDAIEVANASGFGNFDRVTRDDWAYFLNKGKHVTATGNSDSHTAVTQAIGYPRNFVVASTDDPAQFNETEFVANVKAGRVSVSGGIFVTASLEGATPGVLHRPVGAAPKLRVKVQAAPWVAANKLEVFVNGARQTEIALDVATATAANPVVRFDADVPLTLSRDAWIIVAASGPGTLGEVVPGAQPFGFTNPIYVDVDGNGRFDPPNR
ncbi:MAG: CehA/McbA family metallohydrolase [Deltaproteobacteria bacterium]|nr:CehA/McbA family metallohydrolase [Deltaproteobacteria bacterium]